MTDLILTIAMAASFTAIHLFIDRVRLLDVTPRSGWLSLAGGVAVAYVFLHILPELGAHAGEFAGALGRGELAAESIVYALTLSGLVAFYALERKAQLRQAKIADGDPHAGVDAESEVLHGAAYGAFSFMIGYLLMQREDTTGWSTALYFVAMALHFVTADFALYQYNRTAYRRVGRWVLAASVVAGCSLGALITLPKLIVGCVFAFIAGGIILNVLKEELPEEKQSAFLPFLLGVLVFAGLILAERHLV